MLQYTSELLYYTWVSSSPSHIHSKSLSVTVEQRSATVAMGNIIFFPLLLWRFTKMVKPAFCLLRLYVSWYLVSMQEWFYSRLPCYRRTLKGRCRGCRSTLNRQGKQNVLLANKRQSFRGSGQFTSGVIHNPDVTTHALIWIKRCCYSSGNLHGSCP